jgi:hypothetical protein
VPLPGLPWSPEFMAAYEQALAGQPAPIGADRTIPGTLRALAVSYFASPAFRTTRPSTQYTYRNIIDRLCAEHATSVSPCCSESMSSSFSPLVPQRRQPPTHCVAHCGR